MVAKILGIEKGNIPKIVQKMFLNANAKIGITAKY